MTRKPTVSIYREDDYGHEHEITVEIDYNRPCRGRRDSLCGVPGAGPPLEPDDPGGCEVVCARDEDGKEVELTDEEERDAIEDAIEEANEKTNDG